MKIWLSMVAAAAAATAAGYARAHAVPTHTNITRAAVELVRSKVPELSCLNDSQLQIGTAAEDDEPRYMFHFNPVLNGAVAGRTVTSTCTSSQWGLPQSPSCTERGGNAGLVPTAQTLTNNFTWFVARANAKDAQGNPSDAGWNELGYVIHLLEDLSSPAHVRNDPHPPGIDGDPIEAETRTPAAPGGELLAFASPDDAFNALQAWTRSNFFSKDTVFDPGLPGPAAARQDNNYFYDSAGHRIAYKGMRYMLSGLSEASRDRTKATTDDSGVVADQWTRLGPQAVLYVASLIKYYYDTYKPLVNAVQNGGFESGDLKGWTPDTQFGYAAATSEDRRQGRYAARIGRWDQPYQQGGCYRCGPVDGAEPAGSDYIYQDVKLPEGAVELKLSFAYNLVTYDGATYDWFDMFVKSASAGTTLAQPVRRVGGIIAGTPDDWGLYYTTGWRDVTVDLTPYRGQTVRLWFNVTQDGFGDQIATYVDKVQMSCKF